jgi:hypothetical protein
LNFINDIDWNDVIKKEARGYNNTELGEVQGIKDNYIIVQKGILDKEKFYIPKHKVRGYDGKILKLRLSDINLNKYKEEPTNDQYFENFNKVKREITVQDADFKNKTIAVRNIEIHSQRNTTANNYISKDLIKKKARGLGADTYLGEVQQISREYIVTEKGTIDKEKYRFPKSLVKQIDTISDTIYFNITREQAQQFKRK